MSESKNKKIEIETIIDCFVIMPISNQSNYEDNHFTLVYEDIIKPSIINNNMNPIRADETKNTNLIQLDILKKIIQSPIAVCDMSSKNPNVFYELGMRQAFDMPTVLLIDDDTKVPFDISGLRYVTYKKDMSYRNVKTAIENLTNALKETFEKKDDKTEINSLIRLMDITTAKIETTNISKKEKLELLHELELQDIKSSIKQLLRNQNLIVNKIRNDSEHNLGFTPNIVNNIKEDFYIGQTLFLDKKIFGTINGIADQSLIVSRENEPPIIISKNSDLYKSLRVTPF